MLINGAANQIGLTVLQIVNARAGLLGASRVIDDIALDKYTFVRDAYLQRRRSLVFNGDPTGFTASPPPRAAQPRHRPRLHLRRPADLRSDPGEPTTPAER